MITFVIWFTTFKIERIALTFSMLEYLSKSISFSITFLSFRRAICCQEYTFNWDHVKILNASIPRSAYLYPETELVWHYWGNVGTQLLTPEPQVGEAFHFTCPVKEIWCIFFLQRTWDGWGAWDSRYQNQMLLYLPCKPMTTFLPKQYKRKHILGDLQQELNLIHFAHL